MVNSVRNESDDLHAISGVTTSSSVTGGSKVKEAYNEKMASQNNRDILQEEQPKPPKKGISIPMVAWIKNQINVFDPNLLWQATRSRFPSLWSNVTDLAEGQSQY